MNNTVVSSTLFRLISISCLLVLLSGCFGGLGRDDKVDDSPHYYIIDVDRGGVASQFAQNRVLKLKPVKVTSHYRAKNLVFRVDENEFQAKENHLFFSPPEEMFTEQLKRWLQKSGQFSSVTTDQNAEADMVLEAAVTALYGEQREAYSPQSVLEMQFFLMNGDETNTSPLFQTGLKVEVNIDESTPANLVKGWKSGLEELFATLEDDLSGYFSKRNP